ncbi:MAG: GNAT family N-acetyltransferase [Deltaproteobacteria bacterium]|nr:GNAT family N-acetyltransferase [Deltaproteobacteria bacterium]
MHSADDSQSTNGKGRKPVVEVRSMELDDVANVFHLGEKLFTATSVPNLYRTWDEFEVVNLYQTDTDTCLVAEVDEVLAGFALGTVIEKNRSSWTYGYLVWLGVDPKFQRFGVASRLFRRFHELMLEQGARIIMVDTEMDNVPALRFFRKMGFNNAQEHVFLTMNVDDARRRYEKKRPKEP